MSLPLLIEGLIAVGAGVAAGAVFLRRLRKARDEHAKVHDYGQ